MAPNDKLPTSVNPIIVYTAIFGRIDNLYPPKNQPTDGSVRCICFTNRTDLEGFGWEIRPPVWTHPNSERRTARYHKLMSHVVFPSSDLTLWVDGCMTPVEDVRKVFTKHLTGVDITTFKHCERECIYQELQACLKLKKDDPKVMAAQVNGYRTKGYPAKNGLAETAVVFRRHTTQIKLFNEAWWAELSRGSLRDQLSVDYVCWKLKIPYGRLPGKRQVSPYFRWTPHR